MTSGEGIGKTLFKDKPKGIRLSTCTVFYRRFVLQLKLQERSFSLTVVTFRFSPGESYLWLKNVFVRFSDAR